MTLTDDNAHWTKSADTVAVVSLISVISTQSTQRTPVVSVVWVIPPSVVLLRYCPECPSTDTQDWQALFTRCARWYSARVRVTGKPGTLRKRSKFSLMRLSAGFKNFALFLVYESYEISRRRNQNLKITTKATKFLGDLEITTKSEILRWTNHTNPETLSPTNSHHETFSKFLAVLGLSKILAILEGSEEIFPRKRSLARCPCYNYCGYPRSWES